MNVALVPLFFKSAIMRNILEDIDGGHRVLYDFERSSLWQGETRQRCSMYTLSKRRYFKPSIALAFAIASANEARANARLT